MAFTKLTVPIKRFAFRILHQPHVRRQLLLATLVIVGFCLLRPSTIERAPSFIPLVSSPEPASEQQAQTKTTEEEREELFHPFPFPDELQPQVTFWRNIFTKYTTKQAVIHDDRYLNVTYEVINLDSPEFKNTAEAKKAVKAAVAKYEKLLDGLAKNWDRPSKMTDTEQQIHALFKDIPESSYDKHKDAKDRVHSQIGQADRFKAGIIRSGQYMPAMQQIFKERGLPEKLAYLPLIESAFNPFVKSSVGAAGMWQFMRGTGKQYKLKIGNLVDERKDPLLAARAAAELLGHNYKSSASWPLAITAYNFGLQGIKNAARDVGTDDIVTIIERYKGPRFGYASRNFYVEFLTAVDVCLRYTEYYGEMELYPPLALAQIKLSHYVSPKTLEKHTLLTLEEIRNLNPALDKTVFHKGGMIPKGYRLNIPETSQQKFEAQYAAIPQSSKYAYLPVKARHRVKKGETLSTIAQRYGIKMKAIMKVNGIKNSSKIRIGQTLKIPGGYVSLAENSKARSSSSSKASSSGSSSTYRVKKGETLGAIAQHYGIKLKAIMQVNGIKNSSKIRIGQTLHIPGGDVSPAKNSTARASSSGSSSTYRVKKGETLGTIAQKHQTSVKAIAGLNDISDPRKIKIGQTLKIPSKTRKNKDVKYEVRKGQTLTMIAKLHNTSVKAITKANRISNPRRIKAGQVLIIPKG